MQTDSKVRGRTGSPAEESGAAINTGASALAVNGGTPVRDTWLPYGHQVISDADIAAVVATLKSDWLTQGPAIKAFEDAVAAYCKVKYAVAYSSGTAALHGAYFAAGIGEGDEIVTSPITFAATSNAAVYLGARPVFADVQAATGLIDPASARSRITARTKALVGIDFAGQPCDYDELAAIAAEKKIAFIVDAAHSLGGFYKDKPAASRADMSILSFHPVKSITTGEGGMVLTNSADLYEKLCTFRTHGIVKDPAKLTVCEGPWYHEMQFLGFNYRMCDLQAALGTSQMQSLEDFVGKRRELAAMYRRKIAQTLSAYFDCVPELEGRQSAYHLFPILVKTKPYAETRKKVFEALHGENIGVQVHYIPTYKFPYYKELLGRDLSAEMPGAEEFYSREIGLPIFASMTEKDVDDVIAALQKIAGALLA
ncbi:MAG: UDP-4-amino-4,6-dideoxy-N-acetyl-beta-L-altrosamine transaminase [Cyanobacteria bacterium SZAS LIN-2]|nr:UDP-4-amino-4,6-dideoxy-N-acetyl-beta-L-altrosamine transaminase [Cyanobacteria bacterium SZAS LIN-2]